jgi:phosphosulfolactate phosphohydrolase-like enzyme
VDRSPAKVRVALRRPAEACSERAGIAVVIDVLRMTTTASVLMRRMPGPVGVAATLEDLCHFPAGRVIVSELADAAALGPRVDNSPAQVGTFPFADRMPVLVTTNGTRALLSGAAHADRVLLASFRNVRSVAAWIAARAPETAVLLPAGHFASGEARIEDDACAEVLAGLLGGRAVDLAAAAAQVRADPRVTRRVATEPGFAADLDLALEEDPEAPALEFRAAGPGFGYIGYEDSSRRT